jgi:pheophorbide a oxygenase
MRCPRLLLLLLPGAAVAFVPISGPPPTTPTNPSACSSAAVGAAKIYNGEYPWRERWWPVAFERVTDKDKPHAFQLLGVPIAFWHNKQSGQWSAVEDTCPHRLAPLSEGRVDESGCIECPYHGACGRSNRIVQFMI